MRTMTTENIDASLDDLITQVVADAEPTVLSGRNGEKAVLVSFDEFNSWQETNYLLRTPANAEHLRRSIADAEAGRTAPRELIDP